MQPNNVEATMLTTAIPPRMRTTPTNTLARLIRRSAIPPTAMIAPVRMKNGIASSENSAHAAGDFEHDRLERDARVERAKNGGDAQRIGDRHAHGKADESCR